MSNTRSSGPFPDIRFQTKWKSCNPVVRALNAKFHQTLLDLVQRCAPDSILDAGCGEGINLSMLSGRGSWRLEGVDIFEQALDIARQALTDDVVLSVADLHHLPFDDNSFDLVLGTEVLEHVDDPARALREMVRVSRCHLVLSVPREPVWRILNMLRGKYLSDLGNSEGHINHWSGTAFVRFCEREVYVEEWRRNTIPWTFLRCRKYPRSRC